MSSVTIGELIDSNEASIQTGPFGTQLKAQDYVSTGTPVINVKNVGFGTIRHGGLEFIDSKMTEKLSVHILKKGDIVFGRKGAVERHAFIYDHGDGWVQGSDCLRLRINSNRVDNRYVSYYFRTKAHQEWMQALCSFGATMASLNQDIVKRITVPLPPLPTQKKIASILTAYDDLLEANNRRIELLENMAEEIYREWFVRLRFPGHEKVKVVKGVPEGWEIVPVSSLGKIVTGKTPSTANSKFYGEGYHFIKTPDMHRQLFILDTKELLTSEGLRSQPSQVIPENSICVSCIGTGGIVSISTEKCCTNQQINSIILDDLNNLEWSLYTIKGLKSMIEAFGSTGTTMVNLSKGKFSQLKIILPIQSLRNQFNQVVSPMFQQIIQLNKTNRNLIQTREKLLPRLISGKLLVENLNIHFPPSMEETAA